jgi:hypothetical protein
MGWDDRSLWDPDIGSRTSDSVKNRVDRWGVWAEISLVAESVKSYIPAVPR